MVTFKFQCPNTPLITLRKEFIVLNNKVWPSNVTVSILDSDHLPILFHILDHVRATDNLNRVEKFTDWEQFQSLASELISLVKDFS